MAGYNKSLVSFFQRNKKIAEWIYNTSFFPQLGLMQHDAIRKFDPVVREAIRRLPKDVAAQRQFRLSRAMHLSYKNTVLPRSQWMTIEQDVPYLDPYIAQVKKELAAKKKFEKEILSFKMPVKEKAA